MAERYNEGKAIDAVLRHIEARDNATRLNDGRSPDDLRDPDPERRVDYVCTVGKQSAPGVPFRFAMYRWSLPRCELSGRILRRQFIKGDLEKERLIRLEQTCKDKFPKLALWKREGARSVLVLEENDISSTNPQLVYEAMARAEAGMSNAPDEIYLVSTFRPNPWWVTCLRREGKDYYDDGERYHEFDPVTLTQLTKR